MPTRKEPGKEGNAATKKKAGLFLPGKGEHCKEVTWGEEKIAGRNIWRGKKGPTRPNGRTGQYRGQKPRRRGDV